MFLAHEKSINTDFDASNLELCAVNQEAAPSAHEIMLLSILCESVKLFAVATRAMSST